MEQIKQNYKIVSLVDDRDPSDNGGCPLYHTRLVKAEDGYDEVLKGNLTASVSLPKKTARMTSMWTGKRLNGATRLRT